MSIDVERLGARLRARWKHEEVTKLEAATLHAVRAVDDPLTQDEIDDLEVSLLSGYGPECYRRTLIRLLAEVRKSRSVAS